MCPITPFAGLHFGEALGFHDNKCTSSYLSYASLKHGIQNESKYRFHRIVLCLHGIDGRPPRPRARFLPTGEPIEIAPNSYGNKAIRMAMNAAGEPVIAFGTNGHLYVTKWDAAADGFEEPTEIDPNENVFMSDAEGPRLASQGDYVVLTYQLAGQWATGARSVHSTDGGATWSEPVAMAPTATEDHFMPCVGIDDLGNPFAGVKLGNNPATVYEGILRSPDGGTTWLDAVNASDERRWKCGLRVLPFAPVLGRGPVLRPRPQQQQQPA